MSSRTVIFEYFSVHFAFWCCAVSSLEGFSTLQTYSSGSKMMAAYKWMLTVLLLSLVMSGTVAQAPKCPSTHQCANCEPPKREGTPHADMDKAKDEAKKLNGNCLSGICIVGQFDDYVCNGTDVIEQNTPSNTKEQPNAEVVDVEVPQGRAGGAEPEEDSSKAGRLTYSVMTGTMALAFVTAFVTFPFLLLNI